ncbi:MAG: MerC domain-containing protein [Cytophagales bacterium]|nr:MAG: MerC domain-containing protein [Cytophagales bacterium]TAF59401.1 MAG: MerC domain-containing protein [Cytophagales bacterium]
MRAILYTSLKLEKKPRKIFLHACCKKVNYCSYICKMKLQNNHLADWLGMVSSIICLIHCLIVPFIISANTLLEGIDVHFLPEGHDYFFMLLAIVAAYFSTRKHLLNALSLCIWGFVLLFSVSVLLADRFDVFGYMLYVASAGLFLSHFIHARQKPKCTI